MPYVIRNKDGLIMSLHNESSDPAMQWVDGDSPEIQDFLNSMESQDSARSALSSTDQDLIRVIEDLVDLLVKKQLIIFTELPKPVQIKLGARKKIRQDIESLENLINDQNDIL